MVVKADYKKNISKQMFIKVVHRSLKRQYRSITSNAQFVKYFGPTKEKRNERRRKTEKQK